MDAAVCFAAASSINEQNEGVLKLAKASEPSCPTDKPWENVLLHVAICRLHICER